MLIKHYDRLDAFFYCDPPYFASEYVYECEFTWNDHMRLYTRWRRLRENGWCPITTVRKSVSCTEITISSALLAFTQWYKNIKSERNFLNCSFPTMTFMNGKSKNAKQLTIFEMENELSPEENEKSLKECIIQCKIRK